MVSSKRLAELGLGAAAAVFLVSFGFLVRGSADLPAAAAAMAPLPSRQAAAAGRPARPSFDRR